MSEMADVFGLIAEIKREREEELVTLTRRELKQLLFRLYIAEGATISRAEVAAGMMVEECVALRRRQREQD